MERHTILAIASFLLVGCARQQGTQPEPLVVAAAVRPGYDLATEIDVDGSVTAVREVASPRSGKSVHLDLEVGDVTYDVHVGPEFYLEEIGFGPMVGDELRVLGSRRGGHPPVLIARRITKGEQTWTFRDESGRPLWRGRR